MLNFTGKTGVTSSVPLFSGLLLSTGAIGTQFVSFSPSWFHPSPSFCLVTFCPPLSTATTVLYICSPPHNESIHTSTHLIYTHPLPVLSSSSSSSSSSIIADTEGSCFLRWLTSGAFTLGGAEEIQGSICHLHTATAALHSSHHPSVLHPPIRIPFSFSMCCFSIINKNKTKTICGKRFYKIQSTQNVSLRENESGTGFRV